MRVNVLAIICSLFLFSCGGTDNSSQNTDSLIQLNVVAIDEEIQSNINTENDLISDDGRLLPHPYSGISLGFNFEIEGKLLIMSYEDSCFEELPEFYIQISTIDEAPYKALIKTEEFPPFIEDCDIDTPILYDLSVVESFINEYFDVDTGIVEINYPIFNQGMFEF